MRALPVAAAAVLAFATPSIAYAQDAAPPVADPALADMSEKLADPEIQAQASALAQVFLGSMLDLKIGPLAEAMNRATGGEGPDIEPDATIRDLAPEAEELPDQVSEHLPQAMDALSVMTDGMQTMLPALRDMAARMRDAMEQARDPR